MKFFRILSTVSLLSLFAMFSQKEHITFYRTYGYQQGENWVIPARVWVYEHRNIVEHVVTKITKSMGKLRPQEIENFKARFFYFAADDESLKKVIITFDNDPEETSYRVQDKHGKFPRTDLNGIVKGEIKIPVQKARELLTRQGSQDGWLTCRVTIKGQSAVGRIRLLEDRGLSVITDIDDTIKITEVPAGRKITVKNTFFRDFVAAPDMAKRYRELGDASFHYVSGSPWQLYDSLAGFLLSDAAGFPEGTFHMKSMRKNPLNAGTWHDLHEIAAGDATFRQKVTQISELIEAFPHRQFILVGDSGERDPEVYKTIKETFPDQIQAIWIRDIVNARENQPERLQGMTVIPAPTVVKGVSQM
jgi:hypothetical protein